MHTESYNLIVTIAAVTCAALVGFLAGFFIRRSRQESWGGAGSAEALAQLSLELAVEKERSSRLLLLEAENEKQSRALEAERQARVGAEINLAATTASKTQLIGMLEEARTRVIGMETQESEDRLRFERNLQMSADQKSQVEAELAAAAEARANLDHTLNAALERLSKTEGRLEHERAAHTQELNTAREESAKLRTDLATTAEALGQERGQFTKNLKLLQEAKDTMKAEFQVIANDLMSRHGEEFSKSNKEQVSNLLDPLRLRINEFQEGLQNAHLDSTKERAALSEQIKSLTQQSASMTTETINLTRALKGKSQMQGAWGELILSSLLEGSGLRADEEYLTQSHHTTEDGQRLRPDVIIKLPGGQRVIIDAKVSLLAFEAHVNAETEEDRESHLSSHLSSVRSHVKSLSSKGYQGIELSGLDFVIMFIPIEGAFAAALRKDAELARFALQNNVHISSPTSLMVTLRTIENVWKIERRNQNADMIADRAGKLYDKFVGFAEDLLRIGKQVDGAKAAYSDAMSKLQTGSGNLVGQTEKLKELGARASKALPKALNPDLEVPIASPSAQTAQ